MGLELACNLRVGRTAYRGKAHVDSLNFTFRGDTRLDVPLGTVRDAAPERSGALHVTHTSGEFTLELGDNALAAKWADKILHPPSLADKLGLKPGQRIVVLGIDDTAFLRDATVRVGAPLGTRLASQLDIIFHAADSAAELARLAVLKKHLQPAGAIWVVSRKGAAATVKDVDVIRAGKAAGLVDNKVCSFSATHTALRFVIPLAQR
jgi:hypothetical protein